MSPSASELVTVVTAVWFSATLMAAVAPPPFEVIAGAALEEGTVSVIVMAWTSVSEPDATSVAVTSTS